MLTGRQICRALPASGYRSERASAVFGDSPLPIGRSQAGHVLIGTLIILMITGMIGFSFLSSAAYESHDVGRDFEELRAFWRAEEGLARAMASIRAETIPEDGSQLGVPASIVPYADENTDVVVEYPSWSGSAPDTILSSVVSLENGDTLLRLCSSLAPQSVSVYFYLYDQPGKPNFFTGDTVRGGRFHANEGINVAGSPVFDTKVTVAVASNAARTCFSGYPCNPKFLQGIETEASAIRFDNLSDRLRAEAERSFPAGRVAQATFEGDQVKVRYRSYGTGGPFTSAETYSLDTYSTMFFGDTVEVRGVVGRPVTVGAAGAVVITDDIVYEGADPKTGTPPDNNVVLGLISEHDVLVRKSLSDAQRDGGIKIHAAIVAMNSSFRTQNLWDGHMGTMQLRGAVTEVRRNLHGYILYKKYFYGFTRKDWRYDERLMRSAPPSFPVAQTVDGRIKYDVTYWNRDGRF